MGVRGTRKNSRAIVYDKLSSQQRFWDLDCYAKGYSGPVGSGKSYALCYEALKEAARNPGRMGLIAAPTHDRLAKSTVIAFREILNENEIPYRELRSKPPEFHLLEPGVTVLFRSMQEPEALRSMNLAWCGVDELTYCSEESWKRLIARVRRGVEKPSGYFGSRFGVWTPNGHDWVYRNFKSAEKLSGYEAIYVTPDEASGNPHIPPDYYQQMRETYGEDFFRQEALGEYINLGAKAAYSSFTREDNVRDVKFDPNRPLIWSWDFNIGRMSSIIAQRHEDPAGMWATRRGQDDIHVIDELVTPGGVLEACEAFWELLTKDPQQSSTGEKRNEFYLHCERRPIRVQIYGDPHGYAREVSSSFSPWEIVERWINSKRGEIHSEIYVENKDPGFFQRVAASNALLGTASGIRRALIHPRCKGLIRDLEEVRWKLDRHKNNTGELDKSNPNLTHLSDAFAYMAHSSYEDQAHDTRKALPGMPWR